MSEIQFPSCWKQISLGELGEISGGGTPSTKVADYWNGDIYWLVPSEVTKCRGLFISETERRITSEGLANCASKLFLPGTVLMTSRATIGEVVINTVPMATNQGFINIHCNECKTYNEFLAYWIIQNKQVFKDRANGVTFQEISRSNFKTIPIFLPPLPEQRAIAHTLQTIQKAKEARQRELELERERKATLMQYLFTYGTRNEPIKQTEIGEIPESWQLVRLDSITEMASGGTPSKQRLEWWLGEIPWVSTKDLKQPRLWDTEDHISEEALQNGSRLVAAKTLFIAVRGMCLAKDIPVAIAEVPMAFNQDIKALMPLAHIDSDYLLYTLQFLKAHIMRFVGTSAHGTKRLGTSSLQAIQIPLPKTEEQRLIANVLHGCDRKITALEKEISTLYELFRAMLSELMTGRLSTQPLIK